MKIILFENEKLDMCVSLSHIARTYHKWTDLKTSRTCDTMIHWNRVHATYICIRQSDIAVQSCAFLLIFGCRKLPVLCFGINGAWNSSLVRRCWAPNINCELWQRTDVTVRSPICQQKCREEKLISTLIWISPSAAHFNDQVEKIIL